MSSMQGISIKDEEEYCSGTISLLGRESGTGGESCVAPVIFTAGM